MSPIRSFKVLPVCLAVAALATMAQSAHAQTAPAVAVTTDATAAPAATDASAPAKATAASRAQAADDKNTLNAVVVTGTARNTGQKKLATSFSVSTASEEQIKEAAPSSTADLLKIVPGIHVETSGGIGNANIEVRGFPTNSDAPYVTMQLDGVPLYPASTLFFVENSALFRLDSTVERVEVLRGGPATIWSNGQAGATVNFIQKRGTDTPEGSIGYTTGTGGLQRFDMYYGGKLSDNWYVSGGGFFRTSTGVRDTQYPADEGGQASINLTRKLDGGELSVWGRVTRDKNVFYTGIPYTTNDNGDTINGYPGIDPRTGALQGNATRIVNIQTTPGATPGNMNIDMMDGRGVSSSMFGIDFNQKFGKWSLSNKAGYMSASTPTHAMFTSATPVTLGSYISSAVGSANGNAAVLAAAGKAATGGTASYVAGGAAITDMNTPVIRVGMWNVDMDLKAFTNDARLSREIFDGNTLTFGMYNASYSANTLWYLGNNMLMTAQTHAQPVNVALNNGVTVTRLGVDSGAGGLDGRFNGQNNAFTLADEWQVNKQLRLDAGVRWEQQRVTGGFDGGTSGDLDGNPLTTYNNNSGYLTGNFKTTDVTFNKTSATLGAAYLINDNLNTFVRLNTGGRFPNLNEAGIGNVRVVEDTKQYEIGVKAADKNYSLFLTAFHNVFVGQTQTTTLADGSQITTQLGSSAKGVEFEGSFRPLPGLELGFGGVWSEGRFNDGSALDGKLVARQPQFQARFSPSYRFDNDWGSAKVFATVAYIGKRFSDNANLQPLPAYTTLDAGVVFDLNDLEFRITGTNLTDVVGLTEGNARAIGSSGVNDQGVFMARAINGRAFQVSVTKHF
ncbi:MAG: TonB-dependent receptor [Pseudomonadota bacterium]